MSKDANTDEYRPDDLTAGKTVETVSKTEEESIDTNYANSADNAVDCLVDENGKRFSAPLLRDENGRFTKGTGAGLHGGRKPGSRDKITAKMIELAEEMIHERGQEMLERIAEQSPENAWAIALKLIPNLELVQAHQENRTGQKSDQPMSISINLVSALPDATENPVDRIEHGSMPTQAIIEHAAEAAQVLSDDDE